MPGERRPRWGREVDKRSRRGPAQWARLRSRVAAGFAVLTLACAVAGGVTAGVPDPQPIKVSADGTTAVPRTHFFQPPWVLFAQIEDPRRIPSSRELDCSAVGGLRSAPQPADMSQFGAHVVDGESISAVVLFGRSGGDAAIRCAGAGGFEPLWLWPSTEVPPFAPTAFLLLALLALAVTALMYPHTADLPRRLRGALRGEES